MAGEAYKWLNSFPNWAQFVLNIIETVVKTIAKLLILTGIDVLRLLGVKTSAPGGICDAICSASGTNSGGANEAESNFDFFDFES